MEKEKPKFTWEGNEDPEVLKKGCTIMWACGRTKAIQRFVEDLSNKVGAKADWSFQAGRAHIEIMPEGVNKAVELINNEEYMKQFLVEYSDESYENGTYFQILN